MNEVSRQEKKYWITCADQQKLSHRLSRVMTEDSHNGTNGYLVRSLYFDTLDDKDYQDKMDGYSLRRKMRLRIYGPDSPFAQLEMKQKEGMYQKKRSLRMKKDDAMQLILCRYDVLLNYPDSFAAECFGIFHTQCYRPKAVVEYRRKAFIAKENKIRITLDSQITATESCFNIFQPDLCMYPVLDPFHAVLEVKYNGFLLSYIKELVDGVDRSELSVSKYCLSRTIGKNYNL